MSLSFYLDQNALIYLYEKSNNDSAFMSKLNGHIENDKITFVLSPWHWVETAQSKDLAKACPLAEFMDFIRPVWLRDRRDLERTEVEDTFFKFAGVSYSAKRALVGRAELLSAMNNKHVSADQAPSSREFVENWIKKPQLMETIVTSYRQNTDALVRIRSAMASGKITDEVREKGDRELIGGFVPSATPNGILIDSETKRRFLDNVSVERFPTLAIEAAIAEYSWASLGRVDWNSMVDKFHLISSLPYVDFVLSDDRYLYVLFTPAKKTGFVKAEVINFAEFCAKYLV